MLSYADFSCLCCQTVKTIHWYISSFLYHLLLNLLQPIIISSLWQCKMFENYLLSLLKFNMHNSKQPELTAVC